MKLAALFLALSLGVFANEEATTPIGRLVLGDGRVLKNVIVRSYDAPSGKVLLISDGQALLIPLETMPPPFAERIKADAANASRSSDLVQTTPLPPPRTPTTEIPAIPSSTPAVVIPTTPAPSLPPPAPVSARPATVNPREAHKAVATAHARRYYKFEYRTGSNAIAVTDSDIDIEETEAVSGWTNRYRTKGKVFLEVYDSVGGGSFRRSTSRFEILTEQKPDEDIKVVDFTRR